MLGIVVSSPDYASEAKGFFDIVAKGVSFSAAWRPEPFSLTLSPAVLAAQVQSILDATLRNMALPG